MQVVEVLTFGSLKVWLKYLNQKLNDVIKFQNRPECDKIFS